MGVVAKVETVKVDDPDPVTEVGLNEAVAPVGRPVNVKLTVPVKLVPGVTVAV